MHPRFTLPGGSSTREDTIYHAPEHDLDRIGLGDFHRPPLVREVDKWVCVGLGNHPSASAIKVLFLVINKQRDTVI